MPWWEPCLDEWEDVDGYSFAPAEKVCKFCGEGDLEWAGSPRQGWVLVDERGEVHNCPAKRANLADFDYVEVDNHEGRRQSHDTSGMPVDRHNANDKAARRKNRKSAALRGASAGKRRKLSKTRTQAR